VFAAGRRADRGRVGRSHSLYCVCRATVILSQKIESTRMDIRSTNCFGCNHSRGTMAMSAL
jgi:hypothetical protein